ncbi:MAG: recombinase family protein [Oscillospiraceae bacterium]|jgi:DNA invertase Pin-like site-specific DNA recombinase|nr:recombinase family protein [Oscillospiraceae bacterium]
MKETIEQNIEHPEIAIYLRKSRDEENAGLEETLARHRAVLLGIVDSLKLVLVDIYEEVVSGESLFRRPEMLKLLESVQANKYDAVLCMDIDRLGRGGMQDQGLILDTFKQSETKIITPERTYDLTLDFDEQITEMQTFISRQEYKMIRKRLRRGLDTTISEGGYVANPPYGYRRTTVNKKPSLEIYEPEAHFIRMIFDMYCAGDGTTAIADTLNHLGAVPHRSSQWNRNSVRHILLNPTFCGKVVWYKKQHIRPGRRGNAKTITVYNPVEKWLIYDGLHPAIISEEQFQEAAEVRSGRRTPYRRNADVANPLAGLVVCAVCGSKMQRQGSNKGTAYLLCPKAGCVAGAKFEYVETVLIGQLHEELKSIPVDDAALAPLRTFDYAAVADGINKALNRSQAQKEQLYNFLEQGVYDVQTYRQRMAALSERIADLEQQLEKNEKSRRNEERSSVTALRSRLTNVLEVYDESDAAGRNSLLKSVIEHVYYSKAKKTKPRDFSLQIQLKLIPSNSRNP